MLHAIVCALPATATQAAARRRTGRRGLGRRTRIPRSVVGQPRHLCRHRRLQLPAATAVAAVATGAASAARAAGETANGPKDSLL